MGYRCRWATRGRDRETVLLALLESAQAKFGGPKADVDHICDLAPAYAKPQVGFRHDESLGNGEHVPIWQLVSK